MTVPPFVPLDVPAADTAEGDRRACRAPRPGRGPRSDKRCGCRKLRQSDGRRLALSTAAARPYCSCQRAFDNSGSVGTAKPAGRKAPGSAVGGALHRYLRRGPPRPGPTRRRVRTNRPINADAGIDEMNSLAPKLAERFKQIPELRDVASDQQLGRAALMWTMDRNVAALYG